MREVQLDEVRVAGALDCDITSDGVSFRRLPAWSRHQLVDIAFMLMVTMPAGVRLEFETDATDIELDVMLTRLQFHDRPPKPSTFDLVVDDEVVASESSLEGTAILYDPVTGAADFQFGEATTIRFDRAATTGEPASGAVVEVWFPHDSVVELRAVRVNDGARVAPSTRTRSTWIHCGSSISHCMEAPRPTATWPSITARLAGVDLQNFAFAGQCMLDQVVARSIRDTPADVISIKAGINVVNLDSLRERTFVPALHGFLDTIRDGHPSTPIALVTPIICPIVEDHPGPTLAQPNGCFQTTDRPAELAVGALTLQRIRELEADVVTARRAYGDENLHLLSGLDLFGADDVVDLYDNLHPTAAGYERIGERFHALAFAPGAPLSS